MNNLFILLKRTVHSKLNCFDSLLLLIGKLLLQWGSPLMWLLYGSIGFGHGVEGKQWAILFGIEVILSWLILNWTCVFVHMQLLRWLLFLLCLTDVLFRV